MSRKRVCIFASALFLCGSMPLSASAVEVPPPKVFPRQSIKDFAKDPQNVLALEKAVAAMKALPVSNKTSWSCQANIHGIDLAPGEQGDPVWNNCQHHQWWFVVWHRAYLYYFERMLQKYSGDPNLRLPYWNYSDPAQRALPAAFLKQGSPLFEPKRKLLINRGAQIRPEVVDIRPAMSSTSFLDNADQVGFGGVPVQAPTQSADHQDEQGSLEYQPHDLVHDAIGGLMGDPQTAANDPIFWLHHCNIDRLWDVWLKNIHGAANPPSGPWTAQTFSLYDENGTIVSVPMSDFLDSTKLGYTYDDTSLPSQSLLAIEHNIQEHSAVARIAQTTKLEAVTLARSPQARQTVVSTEPTTVKLQLESTEPKAEILNKDHLSTMAAEERVYLHLENIEIDPHAPDLYDIYLNLPSANHRTGSQVAQFVAPLGFFEHAHHGSKTVSKTFDVTRVINRLKSTRSYDPKNISVTLVPVGPIFEGQPTKPASVKEIKIGSFKLEAKKSLGGAPTI